MVFFVMLALLVWIPYSAYVMVKKPGIRASQLARLCIWVLVVPLLFGVHYLRQKIARRNADEIVAMIDGYSKAHGHYPPTLEETGISRKQLKDKLGFAAYFFDQGKPSFFYHGTFTPYAVCRYDFRAGEWSCRPD